MKNVIFTSSKIPGKTGIQVIAAYKLGDGKEMLVAAQYYDKETIDDGMKKELTKAIDYELTYHKYPEDYEVGKAYILPKILVK